MLTAGHSLRHAVVRAFIHNRSFTTASLFKTPTRFFLSCSGASAPVKDGQEKP